MGRFTEEQLACMAPGHSPQELADLDMTDGEWERHGAELKAAHAETTHRLATIRAAGLNALNTTQYDPDVAASARVLHNQTPDGPSPEALIESVIAPIRADYLVAFDSKSPVTTHRAGPNEEAFNKLVGGSDG